MDRFRSFSASVNWDWVLLIVNLRAGEIDRLNDAVVAL